MVPGDKGMAFVEFQNETQSAMALASLNGFQLNESAALSLSFAM
jgi:RNA recognition motif-containing protein